jgi:hypothetical protein
MLKLLRTATAVAAVFALQGPHAAAEMNTEIGAGEGVVDSVAWPGYIERGTTD